MTFSRVYAGEKLPSSVEGIDFLIVMGGPQDPATSIETCPHFDSKAEQAVILQAVKADRRSLVSAWDSQLIGEALGATFDHSPEKELTDFTELS